MTKEITLKEMVGQDHLDLMNRLGAINQTTKKEIVHKLNKNSTAPTEGEWIEQLWQESRESQNN